MNTLHDNRRRHSTREGTTKSPVGWLRTPLTHVSFWGAVTMPVLYVPLFLSGIVGRLRLVPLLTLLGIHLTLLIGGRNHPSRRELGRPDDAAGIETR